MGQGYRGVAKDVAEDETSVADRFDDDSQAKEYTQALLNQLDELATPSESTQPEPQPDSAPTEPDTDPAPTDNAHPDQPDAPTSYEDYLQDDTEATQAGNDLWDARTRPDSPDPQPSADNTPPSEQPALDPEQVDWEDPLTDPDPHPTDGQQLGDVATIHGDAHGITSDGQPLVDPQGSRGGVTDSTMDAEASDGIRGEMGAESNYVATGTTTELNPDLEPDGQAVTAGIIDTDAADYDPEAVLESYQDYLESELDSTPNTDPDALASIKAQNEALDGKLLDEHGSRVRDLTREEADQLFAERHQEFIDGDASPWSGRSSLEGNEHKLGVAKADTAYTQSLRDRGLLPDHNATDAEVAQTSTVATEYVAKLRDGVTRDFTPQESAGDMIPEQDYPNGPKKPIEIPSTPATDADGNPTGSDTQTIHVPDWGFAPDAHCGSLQESNPHPYDGSDPPDDWLVQWQGDRMPKDPADSVDVYVSEADATDYLLEMDEDLRAKVRGRALGMSKRDGAPDTKNIEMKIAAAAQRRGDIISGVEYVRDHLQHYGPSTTPIEDLDDLADRGMTNASVEARVERTKPPRNPESQHQYFELREKKNGKRLQVFSWKQSSPDVEVKEGDYVVIRNAELQEYNGNAQLSTRSYTDIEVADRPNPDAPSRAAPEFEQFTPNDEDTHRNAVGADVDHTAAVPLDQSSANPKNRDGVDISGLFGSDGMLVEHTMEQSSDGDRMIRRRDQATGKEVDVGEFRDYESRTHQTDKRLVEHSEDTFDPRPTTTSMCPSCDNDSAYVYQQGTRKADEGETEFHTCTECSTKWRE